MVFGNLARDGGFNQSNLLIGDKNDVSLPLMVGGGYSLLMTL